MKKTFAIQTFAIDVLLILLSYGVFLLDILRGNDPDPPHWFF
jgi:hypothetical protein